MTNETFEGDESDAVSYEEAGDLVQRLRSGEEPPELSEFRRFYDAIAPRPDHFVADEFMVMGPSNANPSSACHNKNAIPDRAMWDAVVPLVAAMDAIRKQLGYGVRITNCYRAPPYNSCVGGVSGSLHMQFKAADFVAVEGTSADWAAAAKAVRDRGDFSGGIGIYNSFVHVDVRGTPADWDNR